VTTPLQAGSPRPASVPAILGGYLVRRELLRRTVGPVYLSPAIWRFSVTSQSS
jgi:hypothetical protein